MSTFSLDLNALDDSDTIWDMSYGDVEGQFPSARALVDTLGRSLRQRSQEWYYGVPCVVNGSVQLLVQMARGPRHSDYEASGHPTVIVQQISTKPSLRRRGLARQVLRELAVAVQAVIGPTARVLVQAVQNRDLLSMLLGQLGGTRAPGFHEHSFAPDVFLPQGRAR